MIFWNALPSSALQWPSEQATLMSVSLLIHTQAPHPHPHAHPAPLHQPITGLLKSALDGKHPPRRKCETNPWQIAKPLRRRHTWLTPSSTALSTLDHIYTRATHQLRCYANAVKRRNACVGLQTSNIPVHPEYLFKTIYLFTRIHHYSLIYVYMYT